MGLFKKKPDPISERAQTLNRQIAELEAQIRQMSSQPVPETPPPAPSEPPAPAAPPRKKPSASPQPRLRSTTRPQGRGVKANPFHPAQEEPVFEEVKQNPFKGGAEAGAAQSQQELGVRKSDLANLWRRFKNNFRGPATSNPKLVNYLAAGSIQGLRPLRYEKRIARNRFLLLVIILALVLWGIIAIIANR